ncbi:DUF4436 family protein [Kitasatospora sp. NPDC127116]|uniref:DUF4436 family protein n=1 Tax=Kitasatospora sp. NPDC127116 TaxID=3345367 RepID=UPI0036321469
MRLRPGRGRPEGGGTGGTRNRHRRPWEQADERAAAPAGRPEHAPGNPPIGSLLDYAAFFWAELLVAVGLTMVVVRGARVEGGHKDKG